MSASDSLDRLLERFNSGDEKGIEDAFRRFEPYLRRVASRMLPAEMRSKFDSMDIVQSACFDVLVAFRKQGMRFNTSGQLRAFLIRATKNRFVDRFRQNVSATKREQRVELMDAMVPDRVQESPSDEAQAEELWQQLLALCPPEHTRLLELRRKGHSTAEIAQMTAMHEGSVRRILRQLSVRLALQTQLSDRSRA
jgi:RNA polymerase sigma-70 factor (ECF subfamily)